MLLPKAKSQRAPLPTQPGREILDTDYNAKQLRVWITARPGTQPDPAELGETDEVHVAILVNHHQVTRSVGDILKKAKSGEAVVIVCQTPKAYQTALSFLGYSKTTATPTAENSVKTVE